jgi:aminoglycoside phosphotransferase family enzyme
MEQVEIEKLVNSDVFAGFVNRPILKQTHISWVILAGEYAYKIKKPVKNSFLDFSTLEKRKYYCEREVQLNKRLAGEMYVNVLPLFKTEDEISLQGENRNIADYAVLMTRMDSAMEMDRLLENGKVTRRQIAQLARQVADFHKKAEIIKTPFDPAEQQQRFRDLETVGDLIALRLGETAWPLIRQAVDWSAGILKTHLAVFEERVSLGFIRDVHGDLHSGNIFLGKAPVIFDCIEFDDRLRQIDVLDEVAFLSMDLEALGSPALAEHFYQTYLANFPMPETPETRLLFNYYKCYRANVRAKVSALKSVQDAAYVPHVKRYMALLKKYLPAS